MADTTIDVQVIEGLALPYEIGAEAALADPTLNPALDEAWQLLVTAFPDLTLNPTFFLNPPEVIADIADAIRMSSEEPPDLFEWFFLTCADEVADAVLPLVEALPFVAWAGIRSTPVPAGLVSWGTNPGAEGSSQLERAPRSVNPPYGWHVPGGLGEEIDIADIEHAWDLTHEDVADIHIVRASPQLVNKPKYIDHGTNMVGIAAARDNGKGIVGVAPRARVTAVPVGTSEAAAIERAVSIVGRRGVILLELAHQWYAVPDGQDPRPDLPLEFFPPTLAAIRRNTLFGVTVVEPAGNSGDAGLPAINLDANPIFAHITNGKSGAIMVGAGVPTAADADKHERTFTTYGSRVDCFALGDNVVAPSSTSASGYTNANGTSSASAIIAGLVAQIQGMAIALTADFLHCSDIRQLLRDPALGTETTPPDVGIKTMPDLRKICDKRGWQVICPPTVVAINDDTIIVAYLNADLNPVRRRWNFFTGWERLYDNHFASQAKPVHAQQLALTAGPVGGPFPSPMAFEMTANSTDGVHNVWWVSWTGTLGSWLDPRSDPSVFAAGRSLATVRASADTLTVVGINPSGQLSVILGNTGRYVSEGFGPPTVIDPTSRFYRPSDPVVCSRGSEQLDVLTVSDIGLLTWYHGTDTFGAPWSQPVFDDTATEFVPTARLSVVAGATLLEVIAVGVEGWLYWITIDTAAETMSAPTVIDTQVTISGDAPVALVRYGQRLVALAVDTEGLLRSASKDPDADWTELLPVDDNSVVSPLGGVSATVMPGIGIAAVVALRRGSSVCWTRSRDGRDWSPFARTEPEFPVL